MKVRKKSVVVDAWKISDLLDARLGDLPEEVHEAYTEGLIEFEADRITIATLEGVMTGWRDWYLIRGIEGEWYPCDGDIYARSYEEVRQVGEKWHSIEIPAGAINPYANSPEV